MIQEVAATVVQWERKMSLVAEFWWEETGENRGNIKDRERPDGDSLEPKKTKYAMDSSLSSKGLLNGKIITQMEKIEFIFMI